MLLHIVPSIATTLCIKYMGIKDTWIYLINNEC